MKTHKIPTTYSNIAHLLIQSFILRKQEYLCFECNEFDNHLASEQDSEDEVKSVREFGYMIGLVAVLYHRERRNKRLILHEAIQLHNIS